MRWMICTLLTLAALIHSCPGEQRRRRCAQVNCLARVIHPAMLKDMMHTVQRISKSLPNDNKRKYVPKFSVKHRNIMVINKLLEIYDDHVFMKLWKNDQESPKKLADSFHRLKDEVGSCKDSSNATIDQNMEKIITSMTKSFKKLSPDELLFAVGDFQTILNWISIDSDPKLSVNKCQK